MEVWMKVENVKNITKDNVIWSINPVLRMVLDYIYFGYFGEYTLSPPEPWDNENMNKKYLREYYVKVRGERERTGEFVVEEITSGIKSLINKLIGRKPVKIEGRASFDEDYLQWGDVGKFLDSLMLDLINGRHRDEEVTVEHPLRLRREDRIVKYRVKVKPSMVGGEIEIRRKGN